MKKLNLSIIIVTFNSKRYIKNCIDSVVKNNEGRLCTKIVVVDNNSSDSTANTINSLVKKYKNIRFIRNKKNVGFARAVNRGIREYPGQDYYLLLNPDTEMQEGALSKLLYCSITNKSGISGGTTIDSNGNMSGSYFRFPNMQIGIFDFTNFRKLSKSDYWHKRFYYLDIDKNRKAYFPVDVVTGGYMLINSETINKIGLLDETFFMYLEDVDYCLRAKEAGVKIYHTNNSIIMHVGGASSNNKDRIRHSSWLSSRKKYFLKHFGLIENMIIQPIFLLDDLIILISKHLRR